MSIHIDSNARFAPITLLPGDPLRAKAAAEFFFGEGVKPVTKIRNMFGFTGSVPLVGGGEVEFSIMGTGMGMPSCGIYVNELIQFFGVNTLIRVGTAGAYGEQVQVRDLIIGSEACTDSAMVSRMDDCGRDMTLADPELLKKAQAAALESGIDVKCGMVLSTDTFHSPESRKNEWREWAAKGVLCVEMESAILYALAAKYGVRALSILTASDKFPPEEHQQMTSMERQQCFLGMCVLALAAAGYQLDMDQIAP